MYIGQKQYKWNILLRFLIITTRLNRHILTLYVNCLFSLYVSFSLLMSHTDIYLYSFRLHIHTSILLYSHCLFHSFFVFISSTHPFYSFSLSTLSLVFISVEICMVVASSRCPPRITPNSCIYPDHQCTLLWYFPFRRTQI